MVAPTWITPGCVQSLENKERFHTAWTQTGNHLPQRAFQERHMLLVHLRGWGTALGGLDRVRDLLDRYDL